jgi:Zn finger protein HypA/HybF involved in hydrogenase expression
MPIKWTEMELIEAVKHSECLVDVCRKLNIGTRGRNYDTIRTWIDKLKIDTSHFKDANELRKIRSIHKKALTDAEFFIIHPRKSVQTKKRLKKYKKYECEACKLSDNWNNKLLVLQLDHINGNSDDNRIENLRFLCPNCHSQTETFAGKSSRSKVQKKQTTNPEWRRAPRHTQRKVNWPSKEELKVLIENNSFVKIGEMYGVSDNAVRKWAKKYELI